MTPRPLAAFLVRLIWLCMAPLLLLAIWLAWDSLDKQEAKHLREGENLARNYAGTVDQFLKSRIRALNMLAISPLADDPQRWGELYAEAQGFQQSFDTHVIFADTTRQMRFNTRQPYGAKLPLLPLSQGRSAAPLALETGKPQVGDIVLGPIANLSLVAIVVPGLRDGKVAHLMLATLETAQLQKRLDLVALPPGWSLALRDSTGADIARRSPSGFDAARDVDADHRFVVSLEMTSWSVVLEIPSSSHRSSQFRSFLILGSAILLATLLGLLGGTLASRRIGRQVMALSAPPGEKTAGLDIAEVAEARRRIVETAARLDESQMSLRLWAEGFRQVESGLVISDARSNTFIAVNPAFAKQRGYAEDELVGQPLLTVFPAERHEECLTIFRMMNEQTHGVFESEHLCKDGSRIPVLIDVTVVHDTNGTAVKRVAFVLDISDRKRAEQALAEAQAAELAHQRQARIAVLNQMEDANAARRELAELNANLERRVIERTAELTAANQELDAFAYAISHDLRAPLRAMSGFSQALTEDYGGQLSGEARTYLDQIGIACHRMSELIDGILVLSRSTRGELQRDLVDLSALARRHLAELARSEPGRQVAVSVEPGLTAYGDTRMIDDMLGNLIGNAWKYTTRTAMPEIRIYRGEVAGTQGICVSDNGAGFDPAHAELLFKPFQRLHRQDEFPGIGIGLATVQRIVRRHGGEIVASGGPGQGASFCFTLPEYAVQEQS